MKMVEKFYRKSIAALIGKPKALSWLLVVAISTVMGAAKVAPNITTSDRNTIDDVDFF